MNPPALNYFKKVFPTASLVALTAWIVTGAEQSQARSTSQFIQCCRFSFAALASMQASLKGDESYLDLATPFQPTPELHQVLSRLV
ncbi:hypothetical protein LEP3755_50860 [Leptolyngbya sp. NIES-3755]|nr:hypothetical protein LEP3755_50860 [Leptolyngbya sp. NIES-3755]